MEDKISIQKGDRPETTIVTITKEISNTTSLAMLQQQSERLAQQLQAIGEQKAATDSLIEQVIAKQQEPVEKEPPVES